MQVRPTSTTGTHKGKRTLIKAAIFGPLIMVGSFSLLLSVAPTPTSGKTVTLPDGTTTALMTAQPFEPNDQQKTAWYYSVLTDPNILGEDAPVAVGQVSDPHNYSLASDKDPKEADSATQDEESDEEKRASDELAVAIDKAKEDLSNRMDPVAVAWMNYSAKNGVKAWQDGIRSAARKTDTPLSDQVETYLGEADWKEIQAGTVTSKASHYEGRTPSVWVAKDLSQATVTIVVAREVKADGIPDRKDYPSVTISLKPTSTNDAQVVTGWEITNLNTL